MDITADTIDQQEERLELIHAEASDCTRLIALMSDRRRRLLNSPEHADVCDCATEVQR